MTCGEGPLRAVYYQDAPNGGPQNLIVNISRDYGVTWDPASNLTQWNADWISYPSCVAADGVLHLVFEAQLPGVGWRACYFRSEDEGLTWTSRVFPDPIPHGYGTSIAAHGTDVVLSYSWVPPFSTFSGGEPVFRWSRDGGGTWGARLGTSGAMVRPAKWVAHLVVHDGSAYALVLAAPNGSVYLRDTYVWISHAGGPWHPQRIDQDLGMTGHPTNGMLAVHGDDVQAFWIEEGRNGVPYSDYKLYQRRSPDRGASWSPEVVLAAPPSSSDWLSDVRVGRDPIDGQVLSVSWEQHLVGVGSPGMVQVSTDSGATFGPPVTLPAGPHGTPAFGSRDCLVEGPVVAVLGQDKTYLASRGGRPVLHLSTDAGSTWVGGIPFGEFPSGFQGGSGSAFNPVSALSHGSLHTVWRRYESSKPGGGTQTRMYVQGIRVPFAEASLSGRNLVLQLHGIPSNLVGATARWALSEAAGSSPHPENPALQLELGPSKLLLASLTARGIARLSATVVAPGVAVTAPIPIPPAVPAGVSIRVQGWVNPGGLGLPPSDLTAFVTP
ncbi:MAG: hypothetical protein H8E31_03770 [Planctomycetes bacterium]|nr:hypothetical protein [Planctomycetota bacterium]